MTTPLRFLFYKKEIAWPFRSGHDVHTFHLIDKLSMAGHRVAFVTEQPLPPAVLALLHCELHRVVGPGEDATGSSLRGLQERFRRYWGLRAKILGTVEQLSREWDAQVVVASGLEVLPILAAVRGPVRVWYAADEWVLHHLSQVQLTNPGSWLNLRDAAIKGAYERVFRRAIDRAWAVSDQDERALRWIVGVPDVDIIPNGVDADHYAASTGEEQRFTAVFWGRLDFGPNIQALEWFCSRVWPQLIAVRPTARFTIIGFQPTRPIEALAALPGVSLVPDLPDIRGTVGKHAVVVLPFTSGTGIKNKLLEAAAMQKAIVCTPAALGGLSGAVPVHGSNDPDHWVKEIVRLWDDDVARVALGRAAREWVVREHTWKSAASIAANGVRQSLNG